MTLKGFLRFLFGIPEPQAMSQPKSAEDKHIEELRRRQAAVERQMRALGWETDFYEGRRG